MQIPGNPFPTGPGFLQRPQAGSRQQASADLQAKASAPGTEAVQPRPKPAPEAPRAAERPEAPTRANPARTNPTRGETAGLARAQTLEQAVRALADDGRLPARGSLVDLSA